MKYSYEFKKKAVELYKEGKWIDPLDSTINIAGFHHKVRLWVRTAELNGLPALKHKAQYKVWSPEEKYELVAKVLAGASCKYTALQAGISDSQLYQWVRKYKICGYNGLVDKKKGRQSKDPHMNRTKQNSKPKDLNESEREELIRLRAEIAYIRAENEVIKKEIALREEKAAARLKAKKQRSLKNSGKKDIS